MDTYCEQLVKIKKGAKFIFGIIGIWFAVLLVSLLSLIFVRFLAAIIIVAAGYGAYYLCCEGGGDQDKRAVQKTLLFRLVLTHWLLL